MYYTKSYNLIHSHISGCLLITSVIHFIQLQVMHYCRCIESNNEQSKLSVLGKFPGYQRRIISKIINDSLIDTITEISQWQ